MLGVKKNRDGSRLALATDMELGDQNYLKSMEHR